MGRRIGLLGGTFDPPHVGHLIVAECARVELGLDEVRLLVAGDPWMKQTQAPAAVRLELTQLAVDDTPGIIVDAREVDADGPTYTIDAIEELAAAEPDTDWLFIIGADLVSQLDSWHRIDELRSMVRFVVADRDSVGPEHPDGMQRLAIPLIGVSSSDLRDRYRTQRATRHMVPPPVDDRIRMLGLYGASNG